MSTEGVLAALQLSDSALPIGRFVHSHGLESLLGEASDIDLAELVRTVVLESAGPLDGVASAHAHRAETSDDLRALDRWLTARKLAPGARVASVSSGGQLAALVPRLTHAELVCAFATCVRAGGTPGNLAVVHGALAAALGIPIATAVALEVRGFAAGLLSAAVRLGRLGAAEAQAIQHRLIPAVEAAAAEALGLGLDEAMSSAVELELASLRHRRHETRMFMT